MVFKTLATAAALLGVAASNDIEAQEQASVTASASEQAEQRARAKLAEHLQDRAQRNHGDAQRADRRGAIPAWAAESPAQSRSR